MIDYKDMYFKMLQASETAIQILIKAQQECEEIYTSSPQLEWKVISIISEIKEGMEQE